MKRRVLALVLGATAAVLLASAALAQGPNPQAPGRVNHKALLPRRSIESGSRSQNLQRICRSPGRSR